MLRSILAVFLGLVIGSVVNMGLIFLGSELIPPPPGVDVSNADSIAASIHLYQAKHFIAPLLAHALGTLVGTVTAYSIAINHRQRAAWAVGCIFLIGGILAAFMIAAPLWFLTADLVLAYLPMAWLGIKLGSKFVKMADDGSA